MKRIFQTAALCALTAWAAAAPAVEPLVYYDFNELGDTIEDMSGNGHDGTPNGNLELSDDAVEGRSFQFDGAGAYVQLERVIGDNFTVMAWIKTDSPQVNLGANAYHGSGLIWSDVGGVRNDFILAVLGTKLSFFGGNPDTSVNSAEDVTTGEWTHVAGVRDKDNKKLSIYIDGKRVGEKDYANANTLSALQTIAIGGNVLDGRWYAGLVDEVKLYDSALSEQDIQKAQTLSVDPSGKAAAVWGWLKARTHEN